MGHQKIFNVTRLLLMQMAMLLALYQVCRLLFVLVNHAYFPDLDPVRLMQLSFYGIRFDLSALCAINLLYVFLISLPLKVTTSIRYQHIAQRWFVFSNTLAFAFIFSDIAYFPYVRKRMSADVFHLIGKKSDFIDLLPSYLLSFWFVPLLLILFGMALHVWNLMLLKKHSTQQIAKFGFWNVLMWIIHTGLFLLAIRGGIQLKPIGNTNALLVASHSESAIVLNTPFTILHSFNQPEEQRLAYMTDEEMKKEIQPIKHFANRPAFKPYNVVMVILESFGKQYTGIGGRTSFTPFLDSLMQQSLVFTQAFANGHRSADGIPACVSGIPAFMDEPFTTSPYAANELESLPVLLKRKGYRTNFFHGGTNGTMSFDVYAKIAGFDVYHGRSEYGNDEDYDGSWGIWDEPFLQYFAGVCSREKQPFFNTIFTLSSHEPFHLPPSKASSDLASYQGIERGIRYTDMALMRFFETASRTAWYSNTLFVITADHNFLANTDPAGYYNHGVGLYSVPILFFKPGDPLMKGYSNRLTQQIDLLPGILDYLNYPDTFFAYGNSMFDSTATPFLFTQMNQHKQFYTDDIIIAADVNQPEMFYRFSSDSIMRNPLTDVSNAGVLNRYRAFHQLLQHTMIDNTQTANKFLKKRGADR
jgi:phosphoglycerol transferase MdoB-like AlkP superfamily enzyme